MVVSVVSYVGLLLFFFVFFCLLASVTRHDSSSPSSLLLRSSRLLFFLFFLSLFQGCHRANCQFLHEGPSGAASQPCKFLILGACQRGASCVFSHDMSKVPCRFHHGLLGLSGPCRNGDKCMFSHAPITQEEREQFNRVRISRFISSLLQAFFPICYFVTVNA